jgi:hypothetical protein
MKLSAEDIDLLYRGADPKNLAAQWIAANSFRRHLLANSPFSRASCLHGGGAFVPLGTPLGAIRTHQQV